MNTQKHNESEIFRWISATHRAGHSWQNLEFCLRWSDFKAGSYFVRVTLKRMTETKSVLSSFPFIVCGVWFLSLRIRVWVSVPSLSRVNYKQQSAWLLVLVSWKSKAHGRHLVRAFWSCHITRQKDKEHFWGREGGRERRHEREFTFISKPLL